LFSIDNQLPREDAPPAEKPGEKKYGATPNRYHTVASMFPVMALLVKGKHHFFAWFRSWENARWPPFSRASVKQYRLIPEAKDRSVEGSVHLERRFFVRDFGLGMGA
jgi:hypothetical protein